jgi:hypothetical protein
VRPETAGERDLVNWKGLIKAVGKMKAVGQGELLTNT